MFGWFFQRFQQCIGRADRHTVGVVDQTNFSLPDKGAVHNLMLNLTDLLNLDLPSGLFRIRLYDEKVRMGAGLDLPARTARITTVETVRIRGLFTAERLRKANGRQSLSDRILTMEQIGMSQALMIYGSL